jgi:hypothetical protein
MRREDETRGWRFPGKTGSDVCLGRVGGRPHNLVERPQINNEVSIITTLPGYKKTATAGFWRQIPKMAFFILNLQATVA